MANAQVLIYAPTDLETPWKKGETDAEGRFSFLPAAEVDGQWEVTVRKAGHGGNTTFSLGESTGFLAASTPTESPAQRWGTIAAVIWGFVGTALFFSSRVSAGDA